MANIITALRILLSILLLFVLAFPLPFNIIYLLAGFTDMIDRAVERKRNTVSDFGSKLDTAADFIFIIICFVKIFSTIEFPAFIYGWIGCIGLFKIFHTILGFIAEGKFIVIHSIPNKITGLILFLYPLTISFFNVTISSCIICSIATLAALHEGYMIRAKTTINIES